MLTRLLLSCPQWQLNIRYFSGTSNNIERCLRPDSLMKAKSMGNFYDQIREEQIRNKKHLLMVRVGDFYEFYFDDAKTVAPVLGFKMAQTTYRQQPVLFCGFPIYKVNDYVKLLLDKGFSIAKYEQFQQVQQNGQRVIVRHVDRIYTQGTLVEDDFITRNTNFVMSLFSRDQKIDKIGFCCIDLLSGDFIVDECLSRDLNYRLAAIQPKEILAYNLSDFDIERIRSSKTDDCQIMDSTLEQEDKVIIAEGSDIIRRIFNPHEAFSDKIIKRTKILSLETDSWSFFASCLLLRYIVRSHYGALPLLKCPSSFRKDSMLIDTETQKSLEILRTIRRNEKKGSLLNLIDGTLTVAGSRELRKRLCSPSASLPEIQSNLDIVEFFVKLPNVREKVRSVFSDYCKYDASKALQNLRLAYGGPWHVKALCDFITASEIVSECVPQSVTMKDLHFSAVDCNHLKELKQLLEIALPGDCELQKSTSKPGFLNPKSNDELQKSYLEYQECLHKKDTLIEEIRSYFSCAKGWKIRLEEKGTLGPYVEIEDDDAGHDKSDHLKRKGFVHLQTLGGSKKLKTRRYRYDEWSRLYYSINSAHKSYQETEKVAFRMLCEEIFGYRDTLLDIIDMIARLDVASALALKAEEFSFVKPTLCDQPYSIVNEGRHPVVEQCLKSEQQKFTPNNLSLGVDVNGNGYLLQLLTASNMAGKSTFLRQNAIISIMAQAGSFVPAKEAKLGLVDKLFARVGANDDISKNQSTFMVEMLETAYILNHATSRSLVIMDEVGRGTSPEDGLSLAYGIVCYLLQDLKCRTIFATHFHDLVRQLRDKPEFTKIRFSKIDTLLKNDKLYFTHQVVSGISMHSFGIEVARLVGLPQKVISIAKQHKLAK